MEQTKQSGKSTHHNTKLDILRSAAAITVVLRHLLNVYPKNFDKNYDTSAYISYNFPAHLAVLIFFILSGYVIGVNTRRMDDKAGIMDYLKKRLIRIVPIYFIAMFFTIALTYGRYGWQVIMCNLLFISVPCHNVMIENGPIWSLNFELLYYLAFIAFSYFAIDLVKTVKALLLVIALLFLFFHNVYVPPLLLGYLIGFLFWITGAMIAQKQWKTWNISGSRMTAIFLLIFCIQSFNPYGPVIKLLRIPVVDYSAAPWSYTSILYPELYFYALAVILILSLTKSYSRLGVGLVYFVFISAGLRLCMIGKLYGWSFIVQEHYLTPAIILMLSAALWTLNFNMAALKKYIYPFASVGSISYAVYIIHMPLICFFGYFAAASPAYFLVKLAVYFITLAFLSYVLELKFQPVIKRWLYKPKKISQ